MAIEDIHIFEAQQLRVVAEEYRNKGYEVTTEAALDFVPGFRADLIARKDGDVRVIEVKSRISLTKTPEAAKAAKIISSKPGWSYDLHMLGEPEGLYSVENPQSFDRERIRQRIELAESALGAGFPEYGFLVAWAASEAAVRKLVEEEGVAIKRVTSAAYTVGMGVYHGAISREDYNYLTQMARHMHAIVHGFAADEVDGEMARGLIETAKRLLIPNEIDDE